MQWWSVCAAERLLIAPEVEMNKIRSIVTATQTNQESKVAEAT
jgi:hypothetical protein